VAASGTLTFPPGSTTQTLSVTVNGDAVIEPNETFFVNLSGATNAFIADPKAWERSQRRWLARDVLLHAHALPRPGYARSRRGSRRAGATARGPADVRPRGAEVRHSRDRYGRVDQHHRHGATTQGNVRLFPPGVAVPLVSTINFIAGQTRANNAIVQVGDAPTGSVVVLNGAAGTVHFILDVNGYFE